MAVMGTYGHFTCTVCGDTWTGSEGSVARHWKTCTPTTETAASCTCCGRPYEKDTE